MRKPDDYAVQRPWMDDELVHTSWWREGFSSRMDDHESLIFKAFLPRGVAPKVIARIETRLRQRVQQFLTQHQHRVRYAAVTLRDQAGVYSVHHDDRTTDRHTLELRFYLSLLPGTLTLLGLTP